MADDVRAYLDEAASWDADRAAQTTQKLRIAWMVATAGWLATVLGSLAILCLTPLKTVEPFVIRVDSATGIVDVVPMYVGKTDLTGTIARYLLTHYVTLCQGFNLTTAERDYRECGAFQTPQRNEEWSTLWSPTNHNSPLNQYRDGTRLEVEVSAISFFRQTNGVQALAQVRYIVHKHISGGSEATSHWIATIDYGFGPPSRDAKTRQFNPLGFRVAELRVEPETAADATTLSTTDPTSKDGP